MYFVDRVNEVRLQHDKMSEDEFTIQCPLILRKDRRSMAWLARHISPDGESLALPVSKIPSFLKSLMFELHQSPDIGIVASRAMALNSLANKHPNTLRFFYKRITDRLNKLFASDNNKLVLIRLMDTAIELCMPTGDRGLREHLLANGSDILYFIIHALYERELKYMSLLFIYYFLLDQDADIMESFMLLNPDTIVENLLSLLADADANADAKYIACAVIRLFEGAGINIAGEAPLPHDFIDVTTEILDRYYIMLDNIIEPLIN